MFSWIKGYRLKGLPFVLLLLMAGLMCLGVLAVGSAEPSLQKRQLAGAAAGLLLALFFSMIPYRRWMEFAWPVYGACLVLLLLTRLMGDEAGGASRWVDIGILRFQPSEIVKIGMLLFFAAFFERGEDAKSQWRLFLAGTGLAGVLLVLILLQPDLSTTIVTGASYLAVLFLSGIRLRILIGSFLACIPIAAAGTWILSQFGIELFGSYQLTRILAWLNPQEYAQESYQQQNAVMAIGSGRLSGKGLYNEGPLSVKNGNYIPEPQTDFIMAVIGEELGFLGSAAVLLLLFSICLTCIAIGRRASDTAGRLYCAGFGFPVGIQGFVNICVASGLMPNTGLTLPFVSYGLSSLLALCIGAGIVINVGADRREGR